MLYIVKNQFLTGWFQTSDPNLHRYTQISNIVLSSSESKTPFVTEKPVAGIMFSSMHLLIGFCIIIAMFLVLIVLQVCKKRRSRDRKIENREPGVEDGNNTQDGLVTPNQVAYRTITEPISKNLTYTRLEAEYSEINDLRPPASNLLSTSDDYKKQHTSRANVSIKENARSLKLESDTKSTYLTPLYSSELIGT